VKIGDSFSGSKNFKGRIQSDSPVNRRAERRLLPHGPISLSDSLSFGGSFIGGCSHWPLFRFTVVMNHWRKDSEAAVWCQKQNRNNQLNYLDCGDMSPLWLHGEEHEHG
jgi:hypothetical protein